MHRPIQIILIFAAGLTAQASVELTPVAVEYVSEGMRFRHLVFKQEQGQITYQPPNGWTYRSNAGSVQFSPPSSVQAEAVIEQAKLQGPRPIDEACMRSMTQRALQSVPSESQKVSLIRFEENPVIIGGNPTFEVTISYEAYGQAFQKSMLFLYVGDTELVFRLTARKADFETLHTQFRKSLFSWQWK